MGWAKLPRNCKSEILWISLYQNSKASLVNEPMLSMRVQNFCFLLFWLYIYIQRALRSRAFGLNSSIKQIFKWKVFFFFLTDNSIVGEGWFEPWIFLLKILEEPINWVTKLLTKSLFWLLTNRQKFYNLIDIY